MTLPNFQKGFSNIVMIVVVGIIVLGGGYFLYTNLNKPALIKSNSEVISPLFKDSSRSIKDVGDHLGDTPSGSDSDSMERYGQKGKGLIETAQKDIDRLKAQTEKFNYSETAEYKNTLTKYIAKAEELIGYERDNIKISEDYLRPTKDYEELTKDLSGVSNYMYTDPNRYVKEITAGIKKEDEIIKDFEDLNEAGLFEKYHKTYIKILKSERGLLEDAKNAILDRDDEKLNQAIKKYGVDTQENSKELSRVQDEAKDKYMSAIRDVEDLIDEVEQEYSKLKSKYKF